MTVSMARREGGSEQGDSPLPPIPAPPADPSVDTADQEANQPQHDCNNQNKPEYMGGKSKAAEQGQQKKQND
jgi:hypothetical protein